MDLRSCAYRYVISGSMDMHVFNVFVLFFRPIVELLDPWVPSTCSTTGLRIWEHVKKLRSNQAKVAVFMLDHRYSGQDAQLKILLVLSELHGLRGIITWTPPWCYIRLFEVFRCFFKKEGFNPWWKGGIWSYVLHIEGIWEVFKGYSYNNQNSKSPIELNH